MNDELVQQVHDDWKERGFASKSWMVISTESIYHYVRTGMN